MFRIVRTAAAVTLATLVAGGAFLAISGDALADGKTTVQSLKDKGYSCEHAATNMTSCTKTGEKDQTCSESEDTCVILLRVHRGPWTVRVIVPPVAARSL